jgi:hypothetical protein
VRTKTLRLDRGSVLIEVVAFAAVGFGLVLSLGFSVLEQERKVLELHGLARNAMRSFLLHASNDMYEEVSRHQEDSRLWAEESIDVSWTCSPSNCSASNSLIWLRLSSGDLNANAFGVRSG